MLARSRKPDPLARTAVLGVAIGRTAIGIGALLATRPALKVLGFDASDTSARSLARIAGGRDIALGLLTFAARDDRVALLNESGKPPPALRPPRK